MDEIFKPKPLPPFIVDKDHPYCNCGASLEEYENFLISEYGAERVLEVKREEEKHKRMLENISRSDHFLLVALLITSILKRGDTLK